MSIKITKKQAAVLDFISEYQRTHDYSPSYREIAAGLGLTSVASVAEHVDHLVTLGALKRSPGASRSLEIVDLTFPETTALFQTRLLTATPNEVAILRKAGRILGIDLPEETDDRA